MIIKIGITMTKKFQTKNNYLIGIISDTHGFLPQSVAEAFNGVDLIIHAGDIGEPDIIAALEEIAPTIAVRGNMDFGKWAHQLSAEETIEVNKTLLIVLHDVGVANMIHRIKGDVKRISLIAG